MTISQFHVQHNKCCIIQRQCAIARDSPESVPVYHSMLIILEFSEIFIYRQHPDQSDSNLRPAFQGAPLSRACESRPM